MKKIIIFPGQGYQNIEMLTKEVKKFCYENNIGDLLDSVLKDTNPEKKIFDTKYAQALIIATQLEQLNKYKSSQDPDTEYVYCGFSLGEITSLIASGSLKLDEGLTFARERGNLCKNFSQTKLQVGISGSEPRTFSVAKIEYYDGLENDILKFNSTRPDFERISITNYIPDSRVESKKYVTITSESKTLINNLELFGGSPDQTTATMQCPFHSEALLDLMSDQAISFSSCITDINSSGLPSILCTRTAQMYNSGDTLPAINRSLVQYLVQPMQTEKVLLYIKEHYPESEILVTMGKSFAKKLAEQYEVIGGKKENIIYIGDVIKTLTHKEESLRE